METDTSPIIQWLLSFLSVVLFFTSWAPLVPLLRLSLLMYFCYELGLLGEGHVQHCSTFGLLTSRLFFRAL